MVSFISICVNYITVGLSTFTLYSIIGFILSHVSLGTLKDGNLLKILTVNIRLQWKITGVALITAFIRIKITSK